MRSRLTGPLVLAVTLAANPAFAQDHIVPRAALTTAVTNQAKTDAENRDAVRRVLERRDVNDVAKRMGLNVAEANRALAVMSSDELARAASAANAVERDRSGGDTIVISITTLLLLLILIVLIVK